MASHGHCARRGFSHTVSHWQSFGLAFWLPLLFLRWSLRSPHQNLPSSHGAACITPRPIYTPKGKPGSKAVAPWGGEHTALWQQREQEGAGGSGW